MLQGNKPVNFIYYGNYFYGICAVALAVEAGLQQRIALNHPLFYCILFLSTIVYYTIPYREEKSGLVVNKRSIWYTRNARLVKVTQAVLTILALALIGWYLYLFSKNIFSMGFAQWALVVVFPLMGIMYYGVDTKSNLRKLGLLKPFIIGFIWSGLVTVYPEVFSAAEHNQPYQPELFHLWLFVKNMMYVGVLCIMFDIKDYADDYRLKLNTIIVKTGLRKTIFYVLIPLIVMGLGAFLSYAVSQQFQLGKIILNTIPFLLMLWVAYTLSRRRHNILYYLVVVDGLMLVKALCGSLAMIYF